MARLLDGRHFATLAGFVALLIALSLAILPAGSSPASTLAPQETSKLASPILLQSIKNHSRHLADAARLEYAKAFAEDLASYREGSYYKSIEIKSSEQDIDLLLEDGLTAEDVNAMVDMKMVKGIDRNLVILSTRRMGVVLAEVNVLPSGQGVRVAVLLVLRPPSRFVVSISDCFHHDGLVFYSVAEQHRGYIIVRIDAVKLATLTSMAINYRVDVPFELPLMHFFQQSGHVYFILDSKLYIYQENYFDRLNHEMLDGRSGTCITGFNDDSGYYIIIGMKNEVESPVYVFEPMTSTLHLTQRLVTHNVTDVQYFYDRYSDRHYILLLQDGHPAKIYWFGNEQLLEWQELSPGFRGPAIASFTTLGLESMIAVANKSDVVVYVDNLAGYYGANYTLRTSCGRKLLPSNIDALSAFREEFLSSATHGQIENLSILKGDIEQDTYHKYVLSYLCVTSRSKVWMVDNLQAEEISLESPKSQTDDLLKSLSALDIMLKNQQPIIRELNEILDSDSIMLRDSDQTWTGPITIDGILTVDGTLSLEYLKLTEPQRQTSGRTLERLEEQILTLDSNILVLEKDLGNLLYSSGSRVVTTPLVIHELIAEDIKFDKDPDLKSLNGIAILDLERSYLRRLLNQTIYTSIHFDELNAKDVSYLSWDDAISEIYGIINDIPSKDFMRNTLPNQVVTGYHTIANFKSLGNIDNIALSSHPVSINNISTAELVMRGQNAVSFTGSKNFERKLEVETVKVGDIFNRDFSEFASTLVRTNNNETQTLTGSVVIDGDVYVHGDVKVKSIDSIDFAKLNHNALKITGPKQFVTSPVTFMENLTVSSNLLVPSVNDITWNDIIDSFSAQNIKANLILEEALVLDNIISDDINELDLSTDAVLVNKDQVIGGRMRFLQNVTVSGPNGVTMDALSRINDVDPSELRGLLTNVGQVTIKRPFRYDRLLSLNCNITARTINGITIDHLPTHFWRKSVDQTIPVNVTSTKGLVFNEAVKTTTLNHQTLDQYLLNNRKQTITGRYKFDARLIIEKDLTLSHNKTIDDVHLQSVRDQVITLDTEQIISGNINFMGGVSADNLWLDGGNINGIATSELVLMDRSNWFRGNITFQGPVSSDDIFLAGDIITNQVNAVNLSDEVMDMIRIDEDSTIKGDLIFNGITEVVNIITSGTIDGVDLRDLDRTTLKRVSFAPQRVFGPIVVDTNSFFNGTLKVESINSDQWKNFIENVVKSSFTGVISDRKTFIHGVHVLGDANINQIGERNLNKTLSTILTKNSDQNVTGNVTFGDVIIANLTTPAINEIYLDKLELTNKPSFSRKIMHFSAEVLTFNMHAPSDFINGCDIRKLEAHTNWRNYKLKDIDEPMTIERLHVRGDVYTLAHGIELNTMHENATLQQYMSSFVTKSWDQVITGDVVFKRNVAVSNFTTSLVNAIDMDEVMFNSIRKTDATIDCTVNFLGRLESGNVTVVGNLDHSDGVLIDGVNIKELSEDSVKKSKLHSQKISGTKIFTNGFVVYKNFDVVSVNGIPTANFVKIVPNTVVDADVAFQAPLYINGNLQVHGLLDGVKIDVILRDAVPLYNASVPLSTVTFDQLEIKGDIVTSTINNLELSDLVLMDRKEEQVITGDINFAGGLTIDGDIKVTDTVNGVDVGELNSTIVLTDRNEVIRDDVVFKSEVVAPFGRVLGGPLLDLDLDALHAEMDALNQTIKKDLEILHDMDAGVKVVNAMNMARVRALREEFDSVTEVGAYELSDTLGLDISTFFLPNSGQRLVLGLAAENCSEACKAECYCQRQSQVLLITKGGALQPASPLPGVLAVLTTPIAPHVVIDTHTECPNSQSPMTTIGFLNVTSAQRGPLAIAGLHSVVKSALFVSSGQVHAVVISFTPDSVGQIYVLRLYRDFPAFADVGVVVYSTLVEQHLTDVCVFNVDGVWHVVVTSSQGALRVESYRYVWRSHNNTLVLLEKFTGYGVRSCLALNPALPRTQHSSRSPQQQLLLLAEEERAGRHRDQHSTGVLVFRKASGSQSLEQFQRLPVEGVTGMINFTVGQQVLVAMVTRSGFMYIYDFLPGEGFRVVNTVHLPLHHPRSVVWVRSGSSAVASLNEAVPVGLLDHNITIDSLVKSSRSWNHSFDGLLFRPEESPNQFDPFLDRIFRSSSQNSTKLFAGTHFSTVLGKTAKSPSTLDAIDGTTVSVTHDLWTDSYIAVSGATGVVLYRVNVLGVDGSTVLDKMV